MPGWVLHQRSREEELFAVEGPASGVACHRRWRRIHQGPLDEAITPSCCVAPERAV